MEDPKLTIVIPVYNDVKSLKRAIPESLNILEGLDVSFEIIISEDASSDGSFDLGTKFAEQDSRVKLDHSDKRRGKGGALTEALNISRGEIFVFYDVDLSTDLTHLAEILERVSAGSDVVIGSRMLGESDVSRTTDRKVASKGFNLFVRVMLGSRVKDHQCGFKAFRKDKLMTLMPYVNSRGWTWDTEVLSLAQKCGYSVEEIPVNWKQGEGTNLRYMDLIRMGFAVIGLFWRIRVLRKYPKTCV